MATYLLIAVIKSLVFELKKDRNTCTHMLSMILQNVPNEWRSIQGFAIHRRASGMLNASTGSVWLGSRGRNTSSYEPMHRGRCDGQVCWKFVVPRERVVVCTGPALQSWTVTDANPPRQMSQVRSDSFPRVLTRPREPIRTAAATIVCGNPSYGT